MCFEINENVDETGNKETMEYISKEFKIDALIIILKLMFIDNNIFNILLDWDALSTVYRQQLNPYEFLRSLL